MDEFKKTAISSAEKGKGNLKEGRVCECIYVQRIDKRFG